MRKHRKWIYTALLSICMALFLITVPASAAETKVSTETDLTSALADSSISEIKLKSDIDTNNTLTVTVNRIVTLDLNGFVLQMTGQKSVIKVESNGDLTIKDSNASASHRFTPNSDGLWELDETNGTETVSGGVITGGRGVCVLNGASLTMSDDAKILNCSAERSDGLPSSYGGGVSTDTVTKIILEGNALIDQGSASNRVGLYITGGTFTTIINGESGTTAEGVSAARLKFTVTFDNEGVTTTETVDKDSKLTEPTAPTKEGYLFDGWYYDNNGTPTKWDFDTNQVKSSMTLTAQWAES